MDEEAGKAYVLTCKHVVDKAAAGLSVLFPGDNEPRPAAFLGASTTADLSILWVRTRGRTAFTPLAKSAPQTGAAVMQAGYPWYRRQQGIRRRGLVRERLFYHKPFELRLGFQVDSGDSGSGVFGMDRKLVGVIWGYYQDGDACATGVTECWRLIQRGDLKIYFGLRRPKIIAPPAAPAQPAPPNPYWPPPGATPPGVQPPATPPLAPDFGPLLSRLKALEDQLSGHAGQLKLLEGAAGNAQGLLAQAKAEIDALKSSGILSDQRAADLAKRLADAHALLGPLAGKVGELAPLVAKAEAAAGAAGGLAGIAPWLIGGATAGPLGLGLSLLAWLGMRATKKVVGIAGPVPQGQPVSVPDLSPVLGAVQAIAGRLAALESRPTQPAQVIVSPPVQAPVPPAPPTQYVPVAQPSAELDALRQALDLMVQRNPGAQATVEALKNYAAQILSGQIKK